VEAPESLNHDDPEAWRIANPGFDDLVAEKDFASAVLTTPEAEFRTKRLNQWVNVKQAWLPPGAWENLAEDGVRLEPDDEYVLGFDGSWKNDCTAVVAIIKPRFEDDVYRVMRVASWEREMTDDDSWVVDKQLVVNTVMDFVRDNPGCIEIVADVSFWQDEAYQWAQAGLPVVEYPQTLNRLVPATAKLYEGIMAGKIRHDGDGAIQRHIDNCILKMDSKGGSRLTKDYRNPRLKIDLAICLLKSFDRASGKLEPVPHFFG
jgi:phage terminase large subunit-like protein